MPYENSLKKPLEFLARHWFVFLPLLVLALGLPNLGERPYRFEEGRRIVQALAIHDGGSWWRLETFGIDYLFKPPMLPWLIELWGRLLGGIGETAARMSGLLAVAGGAATAGWLAFRIAPERARIAALAAGATFLASQTVFARIRLAETDALATALVAAAFLVWALARLSNRTGILTWAGVALFFSAALMTKGPAPLLFPLAAMVALPVAERRWGELAALCATLGVSALPIAYWLYVNADTTSTTEVAGIVRLTTTEADSAWTYLKLSSESLAKGVLQSMPAAAIAAIWIIRTKAWRRSSQPPMNHALFLYAVPVSIFILVWPYSEGRYAMPAIWPLAVMAGLWIANAWDRRGVATMLAAFLIAFVGIQSAQIALAGRTDAQIAQRRAATALSDAFAELPPGKALLLTPQDYNRYAYVGRNAIWIEASDLDCPPPGPFLLAEDAAAHLPDPARWEQIERIEAAGATLFRRIEDDPGC
ncbi:MAG: glycosyltransferase family 39 protein [Rhizobiaceae bacterium]|nr:glycosyltransferase family 39 protein [Rhizobiaceae bacterium]